MVSFTPLAFHVWISFYRHVLELTSRRSDKLRTAAAVCLAGCSTRCGQNLGTRVLARIIAGMNINRRVARPCWGCPFLGRRLESGDRTVEAYTIKKKVEIRTDKIERRRWKNEAKQSNCFY